MRSPEAIEHSEHALILNISTATLIVLLTINLFYRYWAFDTLSIPGFLSVLALSLVPVLLQIFRSTKIVGLYIATIGLVLLPIAVVQEGGLISIPVIWFPVIPLIAIFFAGIRLGALYVAATLLEVVVIWQLHAINYIPVFGMLNIDLYRYGGVAIVAAVIFSSCMAILSHYQKNKAFEKVKESQDQFKFLASSLPVMVWEVDKNMKIEFCNNRLLEFLGHRSLLAIETIVLKDDLGKFQNASVQAWRERSNFNVEVRCYDANQQIRWLCCSGIPRIRHNKFEGFIGVAIDTTDKVENERALKKVDSARSRFLADLSHELRTPMGFIMGYAELMKDNYAGLSPECLGYLDRISENSKHLLALLNDVLDLDKFSSTTIPLNKTNVLIKSEIASVSETFKVGASGKNIDFKVFIDESIPETVTTDVLRFRQILINLLSNALKFTSVGEVILRADCSKIVGRIPRELTIEVADTGIGIDAAMQRYLFAPYVQADCSIKQRFGGTGLGLALSKKLAIALGGDINIKSSTPGIGSVFVFTLPIENHLALAKGLLKPASTPESVLN